MTEVGGWDAVEVVGATSLLLGLVVVTVVLRRARAPRATLALVGVGGALLVVGLVGGLGVLPRGAGDRAALAALLLALPVALLWIPVGPPRLVRLVVVPVVLVAGGLAAATTSAEVVGAAELVVSLAVVAGVWYRFERGVEAAPGPGRDRLRWLALGLAVTVLLTIPVGFARSSTVLLIGVPVLVLVLPAAVVLGHVLPVGRLDARWVAARVVGLLVSVVLAVAVWSGVVAGLDVAGLDAGSRTVGALAAAGVAVGFGGARRVVDRTVELLLFGDRLDPVSAASRFAEELAAADDPVAVLRALRQVLAVPWACVRDEAGTELIADGTPGAGAAVELPLRAAGESVGVLALELGPGEAALPVQARPVLRIVVPALAQLVRARDLAAELRVSRGRVIGAVEEERDRLRRDLHDGLGPALTGIAYTGEAARNLVTDDPARAAALLEDLRTDATDALGEVRRLVDGLRPAVLDSLGLVEALRRQCLQLRTRGGRPVAVAFEVDGQLDGLGPRTELAVFRVVSEALTNVARHADATWARVRIGTGAGGLEAAVDDGGGSGGPATWVPGGGLRSMRERAEQLGGRLEAGAGPDGGRVRLWLPLPSLPVPLPVPTAVGPEPAPPSVGAPTAAEPGTAAPSPV